MNILSSFTRPHVVPNLYEYLLNTKADITKNVANQSVDGSHWLIWYGENIMVVNGYRHLFL